MGMITWVRPSGSELTTNDGKATIEHCISLGFKMKEDRPKPKKKKEAE